MPQTFEELFGEPAQKTPVSQKGMTFNELFEKQKQQPPIPGRTFDELFGPSATFQPQPQEPKEPLPTFRERVEEGRTGEPAAAALERIGSPPVVAAAGGALAGTALEMVPLSPKEVAIFAATIPVFGVLGLGVKSLGAATIRGLSRYRLGQQTLGLVQRGAVKLFNRKTILKALRQDPSLVNRLPPGILERSGVKLPAVAAAIQELPLPPKGTPGTVGAEVFLERAALEPAKGGKTRIPFRRRKAIKREIAETARRDPEGASPHDDPFSGEHLVQAANKATAADLVQGIGKTQVVWDPAKMKWLPQHILEDMNAKVAAAKADPKIIKELKSLLPDDLRDPERLFAKAGMEEVFRGTFWGERMFQEGQRKVKERLAELYTRHGVTEGGAQDILAALVADGRAKPKLVNLLMQRGANFKKAKALVSEWDVIMGEYAFKFGVKKERLLSRYFPHWWEGVPEDKMISEIVGLRAELAEGITTKVPFFQREREGALGYLDSIMRSTDAYMRTGHRSIYLDQPVAETINFVNKLPLKEKPRLVLALQEFFHDVIGTPRAVEKNLGMHMGSMLTSVSEMVARLPGGVRKEQLRNVIASAANKPPETVFRNVIGTIKSFDALKILGGNFRTPRNILLDDVNTFAEIGWKWVQEGVKLSSRATTDATLKESFQRSGLPALTGFRFVGGNIEAGTRTTLGKHWMALVDAADLHTKRIAYWSGYAKSITETFPGNIARAEEAGALLTHRTQPLFLRSTLPGILRKPAGRVFFQFATPGFKMATLTTSRLTPGKIFRYTTAVATLITAGAYSGMNLWRHLVPFYYDPNGRNYPLIGRWRFGFLRVGPGRLGQTLTGAALLASGGDVGPRILRRSVPGLLTPIPEAAFDVMEALRSRDPALSRIAVAAGFSPARPQKQKFRVTVQ